ncbi:hypothetical protein [Variovorax sp. JS1663]|uniref:hypothetical protein n=1 Tax=Variovorax sp. JS1663 TaxID=1851577 RepID=UPI00117DB9D6|nr:hypothetical protein [Variovorax sp. JS1663]
MELHKVFYNDDGSLHSHFPIFTVAGEDPAEILAAVQTMAEACRKPVIDANDFPDLEPLPHRSMDFTLTLQTRRRPMPPPERRTPELRVVPKISRDESSK